MQLGMIGLGRMGNGMTERLREHGHDVKTYDPQVEARTAASLDELKTQLDAPRAFWMMVPSGDITEGVLTAATRTSATRSGAPARRRSTGCTTSTPASRAASGASRSASA